VQGASLDHLIAAVESDPKVRVAPPVGDITSGSTTCTDGRFAAVANAFETFEEPVVSTPGDKEWTDCHIPLGYLLTIDSRGGALFSWERVPVASS
jgi:hypothetical protein